MKKSNKLVEKLTLKFLEQEIDKQNHSKEEKEDMKRLLKESFEKSQQGLSEPKEIVKIKFENSFYTREGKEYTSAMELMETQEHAEIFKEVLFEKLDNGDFKVYFDDSLKDDSSIFIVYKNNNKLSVDNIYMDEKSNKFPIDLDLLTFSYPKDKKMSNDERDCFIQKLFKYNQNEKIFKLEESTIKKINATDKRMVKQYRNQIFLGFFWRYGMIIIAFLMMFITIVLCKNIKGLYDYRKYIVFPSFGLPLFIMGVDYVLACVFKWKHILLVEQSTNHLKMDPDRASWDNFSSKDFIIVGIVFIVFGVLCLLTPLLFI